VLIVTTLTLLGTVLISWEFVTARAELFQYCEAEYNRNVDLIHQIHFSMSLDRCKALYTGLRGLSLDPL
jgi:hypothetical protein